MLKKAILAVVIFVCASFVVSSAHARGTNPDTGQLYGSAGCGWGSTFSFGGKPGKGSQILAATTNSTFANQTFAITTGTSNCVDKKEGKRADARNYIESNRIAFANDVARGNGETIAGLSQILGCSDAVTLGRSLKGNYGKIFPDQNVGSTSITKSVFRTIENQPNLTCTGV